MAKDIFKAPGHKRRLTHRTITDDSSGRTVEFGGRANYHRSSPISKALEKAKGRTETEGQMHKRHYKEDSSFDRAFKKRFPK